MDSLSKGIVEKYKEFSNYLKEIDMDILESKLSRKELMDLRQKIWDINIRSVPYELGKIIDRKKIEEFPQLLDVYNFPVINNIDFLSRDQLIMLDKELCRFRVGNYVNDGLFFDVIGNYEKKEKDKLVNWLLENSVLVKEYAVVCGQCRECHISSTMSFEEKEKLKRNFTDFKNNDNYDLWEDLYRVLYDACMECETYEELEDMEELHFTSFIKMNMERDTTLDNV